MSPTWGANSKSQVTGLANKPDMTSVDHSLYQNPVAAFHKAHHEA